ncbi:hypothetical protein D9M68_201500 [compost metagenome]
MTPKKTEISAYTIPKMYRVSTCMIIKSPPMIINPKKTSYQSIFLLKKIGSNIEAKNAPVENTASVIETLETFIALKKKIQCRAISKPTPIK